MLHFYPIRLVLTTAFALAALVLLAAAYDGLVGRLGFLHDARAVAGLSSTAALTLYVASHVIWRWIPLVRRLLFPYLGGHWAGELRFEGPKGPEARTVTLDIEHTPFRLTLALESEESTSRTLTVHAERLPGPDGSRLYYVFANRRKEGLPGGGDTYRGLAVLRLDAERDVLHGDYFTERKGSGTLFLSLVARHPWWMPWK